MKRLPPDAIEIGDRHGSAFSFAEAVDPDRPELLAILRERRLAKARVLDVACPSQHRIAQVVKISMGLLWIGEVAALTGNPASPKAVHGALRCFLIHPEKAAGDGELEGECRCRSWPIPTTWIADQLSAGRPRVVFKLAAPERPVFAGVVFDEGDIDARPDILRRG